MSARRIAERLENKEVEKRMERREASIEGLNPRTRERLLKGEETAAYAKTDIPFLEELVRQGFLESLIVRRNVYAMGPSDVHLWRKRRYS